MFEGTYSLIYLLAARRCFATFCCFDYSDFGFSVFFRSDAGNVVNTSSSGAEPGLSQLSPGVGVKLTAAPCCQGCRVNPRGHLNLEGQLSNPATPSSNIPSHPLHTLKRLQLRSTSRSPSGLKKVQRSLLKAWLLADASVNPEGRVAIFQIPGSICMCWWLQNWKRKA